MTRSIIVQMDDEKWTTAALHDACKLAKERGESIALVRFLPSSFLAFGGYLNADEYPFSETEQEEIASYTALAEAEGCALTVYKCDCPDIDRAIEDAADRFDADIVYAHLPHHLLPALDEIEIRTLRQHLADHEHHFRTFEPPAVENGDS